VFNALIAVAPLTDLIAEVSAGATIIGGVIGVVLSRAPRSRRSLEDIALGAAIGGFLGCLISVVVYLLAQATTNV
jgi:phosphate/sulfate permease